MNKLRKIWSWLNGNKTIIASLLWGLFQTSVAENNIPVDVLEIIQWGTAGLAALSGVDHINKGYFSTKAGNPGQSSKVINEKLTAKWMLSKLQGKK